MKKLIAIALIMGAASLFAETPNPAPTPCDCVGIGMPGPSTPKLNKAPAASSTKLVPLTFGQYILYKVELAWWFTVAIYN